jgi:hypothetical protein
VMRLLACALSIVSASACTVVVATSSQPAWVQATISRYAGLPVASPPRAILRTTYSGRTVYFVTATCCDIPSELYEESGELICFPDGGFAGGDGRCPSFTLPPNSVTVWRDARSAKARDAASGGR